LCERKEKKFTNKRKGTSFKKKRGKSQKKMVKKRNMLKTGRATRKQRETEVRGKRGGGVTKGKGIPKKKKPSLKRQLRKGEKSFVERNQPDLADLTTKEKKGGKREGRGEGKRVKRT